MADKLVQLRVPTDVKDRCDDIFARQGLTTQLAMKILLTQIANTGVTPFDDLFKTRQ